MRTTDERRPGRTGGAAPVLEVEHLDVHYGRAHVLQSVSLTLDAGVLAVVGRNGMGKTTLCRAITGMAPASGSVRFQGHELIGLTPDRITRLGVAYVPQGRRVWRSLTVDETLQLASRTARRGDWTVERVYQAFPRLAERRRNGGAQLSGGEQQMLAIGRALLFNPRLLVMDEPTEGLAPVIVEHVATMLKALADEGSISILLIEQNLGVALEVAETVAVMVNGRLARTVSSRDLASDTALQQRLLGLQAGAADTDGPASQDGPSVDAPVILRVQRAHGFSPLVLPVAAQPSAPQGMNGTADGPMSAAVAPMHDAGRAVVVVALDAGRASEVSFVTRRLASEGLHCIAIDAPTRSFDAAAALALRSRLMARGDLAGLVVIAGPGQGGLAAQAVEGLPTTLPKFIVAVDDGVALPSAQAFVVRTVAGPLNRVGEAVLDQVVSGLAALVARVPAAARTRPAVCITTLGFLSPLTRELERRLAPTHECVFVQMDERGQRSLAGLIDSGLVDGLIDLLPLDVPATAASGRGENDRFGRLARAALPYVGTAWGLELLHFAHESQVPTALHVRQAAQGGDGTVWLPATTDEAESTGAWYGERLNACAGPVRLVMPRHGTETLRRLGLYHDALPAQSAVRRSLSRVFKPGQTRRSAESPFAFDDPRFAEALARAFVEASASHAPQPDRDLPRYPTPWPHDITRTPMNGIDFGTFVLTLLAAAIVLGLLYLVFRWLYVRSSKDRAFVRTGLGGQQVVLDGGAFVLPVIHGVTPVNMSTVRLEVVRGQQTALITKDRMRVDVIAEFYVRVQASREAVAAAAQTLGHRTLEPQELKELVEGKFVDALRTNAATMTLEELHERRGAYVRAVRESVAEDLLKNGLELEAASLTQLDQTPMEFFNPNNTFDAEGLTRLTEQIERRKKERNDVEQGTLIAIRTMNMETDKQVLEIEREAEYARLSQQREVEVARVRQRSEIARERAEQEREAEQVQIAARQTIDAARIRAEQTIEQERIRKEKDLQASEVARRTALDLAEQGRIISLAEQSKRQSEAQAAADLARAEAVAAEERVTTLREVEVAERRKTIDLIAAQQAGEKEALRMHLAVEAERRAAEPRGEAIRMQAEADAQAERIRVEAARLRAEADADATRLMNEAQNTLSPEARMSAMRLRLIDRMEGIIRESVKPMERIEGIKILSVNGLGHGPAGGDASGGQGMADQVVNSALRYRAQAPLIDHLMREIGLESHGVERMAQSLLPSAVQAAHDEAAPDADARPVERQRTEGA